MTKKQNILIISILGFVIISLAIFAKSGMSNRFFGSQKHLEAATDPAFPEQIGKLMDGFPEFPVYPQAKLVASAKTNPANEPDLGYRAKWDTQASVIDVMAWYETELPKSGWSYEAPDDKASSGEQVAKISKGDLTGYVAAEIEGNVVEIVVDLRKD
jgi:hypothetical protein